MRALRVLLLTFAMSALLAVGASPTIAKHGGGGGNGGTQGNACPPQSSGFPHTPPPGCGRVLGDGSCFDRVDNDGDGRTDAGDSECRDPSDGCENGAPGCDGGGGGGGGCPPADGPISGIVQQISDQIRAGGGAPLADLVDTVNCQLIVGVLGL